MVSPGHNELIGVIALVLHDIHHNIIVFCNISWIWTEYENKMVIEIEMKMIPIISFLIDALVFSTS